MISGIGTDIVEIARVRSVLDGPSKDRFLRRILTEAEYQVALLRPGRLAEFAAGRFAAKEAVVKALGCGIGESAGFHDIEIMSDRRGKPECTLSDEARAKLGLKASDRILISISHSESSAVAFAIWEQE